MKFIYSRLTAGPEKSFIVFLEHQANVFLVDAEEFEPYRFGQMFRCRGGWTRSSPLLLSLPSPSTWYLIVDLADQDLAISAHIEVMWTREAERMSWEGLRRSVPLHKGFRLRTPDFVSRGIWVIDPVDESEAIQMRLTRGLR